MSETATGDAPGASAVSESFALSERFCASRRAERFGVCAGGVLPLRFEWQVGSSYRTVTGGRDRSSQLDELAI